MNVWAWILVGYFIVNMIVAPTEVGKAKVATGGVVAVSIVIWLGLIAVVFAAVNS